MTVRVEVPEGHKFCPLCGGVFPKATHFSASQEKLAKGGYATRYRRECKSCQWENNRRRRVGEAAKLAPQDLDLVAEQINDACFSGEQVVYRHKGRIKWARYGATVPHGADMLGRFGLGADYRDLRGSLEA